jgi:hypothetical protein
MSTEPEGKRVNRWPRRPLAELQKESDDRHRAQDRLEQKWADDKHKAAELLDAQINHILREGRWLGAPPLKDGE